MKFEKITLTAEPTKDYQKFSASMEVSIEDEKELERIPEIKQWLIKQAEDGLNELVKHMVIMENECAQAKNPQPIQQYYPEPKYRPTPAVPTTGAKRASEAQLNLLHNLGYTGDYTNMTSKKAFDTIQQLLGSKNGD